MDRPLYFRFDSRYPHRAPRLVSPALGDEVWPKKHEALVCRYPNGKTIILQQGARAHVEMSEALVSAVDRVIIESAELLARVESDKPRLLEIVDSPLR